MNLNREGAIARFYMRTYDKSITQLPKNFCIFFWKIVFAIFAMPLIWSTFLWEDFINSELNNELSMMAKRLAAGFIGTLLFFLGIVVVFLVGTGVYHHPFVMMGATSFVMLIAFYRAWRKMKPVANKPSVVGEFAFETVQVIATKISSVKENHCPRINWE